MNTIWDPDELAELLGASDGPGTSGASASPDGADITPEPVSPAIGWIAARLIEPKPDDCSAAFFGLIGQCRDNGLTVGQALTVADWWPHTPARYSDRLAEQVTTCWGRVEDKILTANPGKYLDKHEGLKAVTLALDVLAIGPLAEGGDDIMWSYNDGVWAPDRHVVRGRVARLLGERYRRGHSGTAEDVVRVTCNRTITSDPVAKYINFRNGLLDWSTGELHDHTPDVPSTVQLTVGWNPEATCPEFDKFLSEVVPADMTDLMWEMVGYLLYSGNPLHKAIMFMGKGRNGKGTLIRVIEALIGEHNITSVSLQDLVGTRFSTASLFGKIANIAGDIDGSYVENTATFKAITGQDMISAEHKGRDRFDFTPWAVPVFSANKIPASSDVTTGYLSRWLVVPFPHNFTGREDRHLDAKLQTEGELQGIAAKAVPALRRLLDRGDFDLPESGERAREEFVRRVDQVRTWLAECCTLDPSLPFMSRTTLYLDYKEWTSRDGHKPVKASEFYDRLETAGLHPTKYAGTRGFAGISLGQVEHAEHHTAAAAVVKTGEILGQVELGQVEPAPSAPPLTCEDASLGQLGQLAHTAANQTSRPNNSSRDDLPQLPQDAPSAVAALGCGNRSHSPRLVRGQLICDDCTAEGGDR